MGEENKEIRWRKIGGGSLRYIRGKIIKPNEVFLARIEEVPSSFRRYVVALEDIPEPVPVKSFEVRRQKKTTKKDNMVYTALKRPAGNGRWWDVVNSVSKKVINEKGMREEAAKQLVMELNA